MIELKSDGLVFSFPEVHAQAKLSIDFQRTFRIPDDDGDYPLPPGLGRFPLRHVDDFAESVPRSWIAHGGVMLPMYQSEALWLNFDPSHVAERGASYPFAVKVAAGKINAVSGQGWSNGLNAPPQDYLVVPTQPWLDGYCVQKGVIRQFVAMPLGAGYTAEEQITGRAEFGGLQIVVYPMKRDVFERRFRKTRSRGKDVVCRSVAAMPAAPDMGLAPGGRMRQEIYHDRFDIGDWDQDHGSRCFVHIANSLVWRAITDHQPPTVPPTAKQYTSAGLPWFEYYDDAAALSGSETLEALKSILAVARAKSDTPLPENESVTPHRVVRLGKDHVREGVF